MLDTRKGTVGLTSARDSQGVLRATVRGTIWTVTDRCDGTLTKVTRGRVMVPDLRRRKNITLRAGKSYFARAPRRADRGL